MTSGLPLRLYGTTLGVLVLVFLLFPELDLTVSAWFYEPGQGFLLNHVQPFQAIHDNLAIPILATLIGAAAIFAVNLRRGSAILSLRGRGFALVVLSLMIAPGLVTNLVLKDQWGRARPVQIEQFGGPGTFTPAMVMSDQCERNCSFVAGDPSVGFWFLVFAFLASRFRLAIAAGAVSLGLALGLMRIAQGGHFFSDVLFSGLFSLGTIWLLHTLIMERDGPRRIARAVIASGRRMTGWLQANWRDGRMGRLRVAAALSLVAIVIGIFLVDLRLAAWVRELDPGTVQVFRFITQFGDSFGYLVGSALATLGLRAAAGRVRDQDLAQRLRSWSWLPIFLFTAIAVAGLSNDLFKGLFGRFRPKMYFGDAGLYGFAFFRIGHAYNAFPSGHSSTAFAVATVLAITWPRHIALYMAVACLIGVSRVVVGAHWPSDVIGGGFIGVVATLYVHHIFAANGTSMAAALSGTARWHRVGSWVQTLYLDRLRASLRALWRTLVGDGRGQVRSVMRSPYDVKSGMADHGR